MARGLIQVPRLDAILSKLLGITEDPGASQLSGNVQGVLVLENDRPEWHFLGGGSRWCVMATQAAVAAEFGFVDLNNPANSGVLVVLESILFTNQLAATQQVFDVSETTVTAVTAFGQRLDMRQDVTGTGTDQGTAVGAMISPMLRVTIPAATTLVLPLSWVLTANTAVRAQDVTANEAVRVGFIYRVRHLEQSEVR